MMMILNHVRVKNDLGYDMDEFDKRLKTGNSFYQEKRPVKSARPGP